MIDYFKMIKDIIKKHKFLLSVFVVSVAMGGFLFSYFSYNIVALVDGKIIWKKDMDETVNLMIKYYDTDSHHSVTEISDSEFFQDKDLLNRMQKEALARIIDYKILISELEKINPDWKDLATAKIDDAISQTESADKFEEGIKAIYGMSFNDFKSKVLMPQAQFEIISDELKNDGKEYDQWIKDKKKETEIKIFIDGLMWKDGEVVVR